MRFLLANLLCAIAAILVVIAMRVERREAMLNLRAGFEQLVDELTDMESETCPNHGCPLVGGIRCLRCNPYARRPE